MIALLGQPSLSINWYLLPLNSKSFFFRLEENHKAKKRKQLLFPGSHMLFFLLILHCCQQDVGEPVMLTGTPAGGCLPIIPSPPTPQQTFLPSRRLQSHPLLWGCEFHPQRERLFVFSFLGYSPSATEIVVVSYIFHSNILSQSFFHPFKVVSHVFYQLIIP